MAENRLATHRIALSVGERIDDAPVGTSTFWVGPDAIVVDLDANVYLNRWAPTHPYRNNYLAFIPVVVVVSETRIGIEDRHITVDISNGATGKWVKRTIDDWSFVGIDELRQ